MQLKPLIFVTGKGGVGKSTIAAALALGLSQKGKRVLLVEFGEKSFFEKFFQLPRVGYKPHVISSGLELSLWDYISCLREYVGFYVKTDKVFDLFFSNQIVQKFIQAAPSLKELALLGKATSQPRKVGPSLGYDHIIIDSYSTGHHKALLKAPFGMSEVIQRGPMGVHSREMIRVIQDPTYTQHFIVLKPEELPVVEGLELQSQLRTDFLIEAHLVCNQILTYPKISNTASEPVEVFFREENELQKKYLNLLEDKRALTAQHCFHKKDKIAFLNSIFRDLVASGVVIP